MRAAPFLYPIPSDDSIREDLREIVARDGLAKAARDLSGGNPKELDPKKLARWIAMGEDGIPESRLGYADVHELQKHLPSLRGIDLPPWEDVRSELDALNGAYDTLTLTILASLMSAYGEKHDPRSVKKWLLAEGHRDKRQPPYAAIASVWNTLAHGRYENTGRPYLVRDVMLRLARTREVSPFGLRIILRDAQPIGLSWDRTLWKASKSEPGAGIHQPARSTKGAAIVYFDSRGAEIKEGTASREHFPVIPSDLLARDGRRTAVETGQWHIVEENGSFVGILPPWGYTKSLLMQGKRWAPSGFAYSCPAECGAEHATYLLGRPGYQSMVCTACGEYKTTWHGRFTPRIPQTVALDDAGPALPPPWPNGPYSITVAPAGRDVKPLKVGWNTQAEAGIVAKELRIQIESRGAMAVVSVSKSKAP